MALGNAGDGDSLPALRTALLNNTSPLVREHAAWALGRLARAYPDEVRPILHEAHQSETDRGVLDEIHRALHGLAGLTPNPSG